MYVQLRVTENCHASSTCICISHQSHDGCTRTAWALTRLAWQLGSINKTIGIRWLRVLCAGQITRTGYSCQLQRSQLHSWPLARWRRHRAASIGQMDIFMGTAMGAYGEMRLSYGPTAALKDCHDPADWAAALRKRASWSPAGGHLSASSTSATMMPGSPLALLVGNGRATTFASQASPALFSLRLAQLAPSLFCRRPA